MPLRVVITVIPLAATSAVPSTVVAATLSVVPQAVAQVTVQ